MRIAIIGTGISGLTCAHLLAAHHDVTVFEREGRPGGHANTVRVDLGDETHDVDTGFIVYNERNYPGLVRLFERLGVPTKPSDMSFGVTDTAAGVEWRATSPSTVLAQRRNALRPEFLRMLADIIRFNRTTRRLLVTGVPEALTLRQLVAEHRWSPRLATWYLAPMVSAIWSAPASAALDIPVATFARFFENHGLLRLGAQPNWRTVDGGARTYVDRIVTPLGDRVRLATPVAKVTRGPDGVEVLTDRHGPERFDHVILAADSDQSLELLGDPTAAEREVLGNIRYQPNTAVLHTDERLLPRGSAGVGQLERPTERRRRGQQRRRDPYVLHEPAAVDRFPAPDLRHPQPDEGRRSECDPRRLPSTRIPSSMPLRSRRRSATWRSAEPRRRGTAARTGATASTRTACRARRRVCRALGAEL